MRYNSILWFYCILLISLSAPLTTASNSVNGIDYNVLLKEMPEDVPSLSTFRHKLIRNQFILEKELDDLKRERYYLPLSIENLEMDIQLIQKHIDDTKNDLKAVTENFNSVNNSDNTEDQDSKEIYKQQIEKMEYKIKRFERELKTYKDNKARVLELNKKIELKKREIEQNANVQYNIEQKISNLLSFEQKKNEFRKWVSFSFCALVAFVIIGFYIIALKKENIANTIFAGEKGIQFVTLFLVVIAIILFGIMGILEGKELSALLGGLSGYILGRSSTQKHESNESK